MKNKLYLIAIVSLLTISSIACGKEKTAPAIEGTPVAEEPAVEEEETVEKTTTPTTEEEPAEITEPTVSDNEVEETTDESEEDDGLAEVYTQEDIDSFPAGDVQYVKDLYKFVCRMDSTMPVTDDIVEIYNLDVWNIANAEFLLNLLNEDFAKAYDIIEECGITVTNDEGKELVPTEMRTTITDFDSFHDAYMDIIDYTGLLMDYSGKCKDEFDKAIKNEDLNTAQEMYDIGIKTYDAALTMDKFVDFYQMAYTRSEK